MHQQGAVTTKHVRQEARHGEQLLGGNVHLVALLEGLAVHAVGTLDGEHLHRIGGRWCGEAGDSLCSRGGHGGRVLPGGKFGAQAANTHHLGNWAKHLLDLADLSLVL